MLDHSHCAALYWWTAIAATFVQLRGRCAEVSSKRARQMCAVGEAALEADFGERQPGMLNEAFGATQA